MASSTSNLPLVQVLSPHDQEDSDAWMTAIVSHLPASCGQHPLKLWACVWHRPWALLP